MWAIAAASAAASFACSYLLTPVVMRVARSRGFVGVDVHKPGRPEVPTLGGIAVALAIAVGCLPLAPLYPVQVATFLLTTLIGAATGLVDDLRPLSGYPKMIITVVASAPLIAAGYLFPSDVRLGRPLVPIMGRLRLTIVYWLLLPLAVAAPSNAVNMLEVFNGVMPITCGIAALSLAASSAIAGSQLGLALSLVLLASLLGYLPYNKYPARVFSGNVGSYAVGSAIGALAVLSGLEFELMIVLLPHVLNALLVILSVGGIKERRSIRVRPIVVRPGGILEANPDPQAPMTLTRAILAISGPLREPDIVKVMAALEAWSATLSLLSTVLKVVSA